jgi:carnitine 3-dehydrogenase
MSPIPGLSRVGLLGGGVIGGGWAARFLLNGVDVVMYDPDPEAPRKVGEVLANARRALSKLVMPALPPEGTLTFVATPEEAATGVDFLQESAPERLELKQELLARASTAAPAHVVFGSSTSGLLPTELQRRMTHPERLVVGHPFNPVYLLPLVEVCGGEQSSSAAADRAAEVYESIGMHPLRLSVEIDGFVADRLLEALWREALWLINDGVATAEQIDDAIRYGAGLRWSFMGTLLVYRIAGGEAGMRHFMAQFGPALQWPWTKLMDVPELTDELLDRIVTQSDDQAAGRSIRELEALRDDCLVAVMQGLRSVDGGAGPGKGFASGTVLDRYERALFERTGDALPDVDLAGPLRLHTRRVPTDWVDYNGHTNDARYLQLMSEGIDRFLRFIGMDAAYLASGRSFFTVEAHVNYVAQSRAGDELAVDLQLISHDPKKLRVFCEARHTSTGELVATSEFMMLHVDTALDKAVPMSDEIATKLDEIAAHHSVLPAPANAGRAIGQPRA